MVGLVLEYFKEHHLTLLTAVVGGIFSLYQVRKSQVYKSLSYDVEITRLFTLNDNNVGELAISFNGQRVDDPYLIRLTIFSSGKAPISKNDYERPIKISFPEGAKILSVAAIETQPEDISIEFQTEQNSINLHPTLFNEGDSITLKILLEAAAPSLKIDARIEGVKNVTRTKFKSSREKRNSKILYLGLGLYLLGVILAFYAISIHDNSLEGFALYILAGSVITILFLREPGGDFLITRILRKFFGRDS
jgi:hypothetical protein